MLFCPAFSSLPCAVPRRTQMLRLPTPAICGGGRDGSRLLPRLDRLGARPLRLPPHPAKLRHGGLSCAHRHRVRRRAVLFWASTLMPAGAVGARLAVASRVRVRGAGCGVRGEEMGALFCGAEQTTDDDWRDGTVSSAGPAGGHVHRSSPRDTPRQPATNLRVPGLIPSPTHSPKRGKRLCHSDFNWPVDPLTPMNVIHGSRTLNVER